MIYLHHSQFLIRMLEESWLVRYGNVHNFWMKGAWTDENQTGCLLGLQTVLSFLKTVLVEFRRPEADWRVISLSCSPELPRLWMLLHVLTHWLHLVSTPLLYKLISHWLLKYTPFENLVEIALFVWHLFYITWWSMCGVQTQFSGCLLWSTAKKMNIYRVLLLLSVSSTSVLVRL